jgi:hypothetical protein
MQPHTMEELITHSPILATICNIEEQDNIISIIFSVEFGPSTREFPLFGVGHSNNAFSLLGDNCSMIRALRSATHARNPVPFPKLRNV